MTLQYKPNGEFAGFGYVTKTLEQGGGEPLYVGNATLTLYEGLEVKQTGEHEYEGVEVKRNLFDSVIGIKAHNTGVDTDIRVTGRIPLESRSGISPRNPIPRRICGITIWITTRRNWIRRQEFYTVWMTGETGSVCWIPRQAWPM